MSLKCNYNNNKRDYINMIFKSSRNWPFSLISPLKELLQKGLREKSVWKVSLRHLSHFLTFLLTLAFFSKLKKTTITSNIFHFCLSAADSS